MRGRFNKLSWKVRLAAAVGAYTLVAGIWIGGLHVDSAEAEHSRVALPGWHALAACLVGDLREGESASLRMREIAFSASEDSTWPKACGPVARDLLAALDDVEPASSSSLHASWSCVRQNVETIQNALASSTEPPSSTSVDNAFDCAAKLVAPGEPPSDTPRSPDTPRILRAVPTFGHGDLRETDRHHTPSFRLRLTSHVGYCRFDRLKATCAGATDAMMHDFVDADLVPTSVEDETFVRIEHQSGGASLYALGDGRELLRSDGRIIDAFVSRDTTYAIVRDGSDLLVAKTKDGEERTAMEGRDPRIIGDRIWWTDGEPEVLHSRPIADPKAEAIELGNVGWYELRDALSCTSKGVTWVVTKGAAIRVAEGLPQRFDLGLVDQATLSCRAGELVMTRMDGDVVSVQRCGDKGCHPEERATLSLGRNGKHAAVSLGSTVIVAGSEHGLRLRVAPIGELGQTPARIIMNNDGANGGVLVHDVQLEAREDAAYLVVHSGDGTFVLHVDERGVVTPLEP